MTRSHADRAATRRSALLAIAPVAFVAVLFAWPVAEIIGRGLGAQALWDAATDTRLRAIAWFTLWQAVVSTVLTLAVGVPAAWALGRCEFPGRRLATAVATAPFVLPTIVVGAAFLALLPSSLDQSVWAILAAHVFFNVAVVVRTVGGMWSHLDTRLADAARTLGASPVRVAREVTLPLLGPAIAAASTLVFLFTFTSFGVVLILGGPRRSTLEVEIYRQTAELLALDRAAALALFQLAAMAVVLWFAGRWQRRRSVAIRTLSVDRRMRPRGARQWAAVGAVLAALAALVAAPLGVLAERALRDPDGTGHGFTNFRALAHQRPGTGLFVAPLASVGNSVRYAAMACAVATVVGSLAAFAIAGGRGRLARVLDTLLMLPLGTSSVTIGFGFLIAFDTAPFDWRSRWFAVPLVQAVVGLPFVVRAVLPVVRAVDPRLREVAATLGASPGRVWREVDLALAKRALAVGAAFAFAVSLGEFGATTFLARPDAPTMPVAIARLLGRPGSTNAGQAMALAALLAALTGTVMLVAEAFRSGRAGSASEL